jgi:hypothetical protein
VSTAVARRVRSPRHDRFRWVITLVAALLPAVVGRLFVGGMELVNFEQLIAGTLAVGVIVLVARRPSAAVSALVVVLPFQLPLTALVYSVGVPGGITRMAALWKELVVLAIMVAAWRRSRDRDHREVDALDRCALAFVALGTAYFLLPELFVGGLGADLSLDARFVAWRLIVLPSVLLIATRRLRFSADEVRRVLRAVTAMGALLGVTAVIEVVFSDWWNHLLVDTVGLNRYRVDVLGIDLRSQGISAIDIRIYGEVAGHIIVRVGGPMVSHLTFSFVLLIVLGVLFERLVRADASVTVLMWLVACGVGLAYTQTRSSIVGAGVLLVMVLRPAPGRTTAGRTRYGVLAGLVVVVAVPLLLGSALGERFTHGDRFSDEVHSVRIDTALDTVVHHPAGLGLGMGSTAGGRATEGAVSVENQPLDTAVQLGVLGTVLLFAQYGLLIVALGRAAKDAGPGAQTLAFGIRAAMVGFLVPLWYQQAFGLVEVAWVLFAIAGSALGAVEADRHRVEVPV